MKPEIPILMSLFASFAYAIKVAVEARMRSKLLGTHGPDELIRTLVLSDERQRRHSSLRWGIVLSFLAAGFALIQAIGWQDITAGVIAVLLGATGLGNIVSFLVSRKIETPRPPGIA